MFGKLFILISLFLWNFTFASLPHLHHHHHHDDLDGLIGDPSPYHLPVHDSEYITPSHPHHLPPPPLHPPPPQHSAPIIEIKPLVERVPVDPAHCALIVPDHRPPVASISPDLPYIDSNNYLVG